MATDREELKRRAREWLELGTYGLPGPERGTQYLVPLSETLETAGDQNYSLSEEDVARIRLNMPGLSERQRARLRRLHESGVLVF